MGLIKDKKGMFFTISAILILLIFAVSYSIYEISNQSVNERIRSMNNFIFSIEKDLPRQIYISGYRSILVFEKKIVEKGLPIDNVNARFSECFFNGSFNSQEQELMSGITYSDIQNSLKEFGNNVNVDVDISNPRIFVNQTDPWNVKITFICDLIARDVGNLAFWNKTETIVVYIPIERFEDPLYTLNTHGVVASKISKTIYQPFLESELSKLKYHLDENYYIESNLAPSFLDRLEGRNTANIQGIESLVDLQELSNKGFSVKDKSCVDYIYFSGDEPESKAISGMPEWFKLDNSHLGIYNVTNLAI